MHWENSKDASINAASTSGSTSNSSGKALRSMSSQAINASSNSSSLSTCTSSKFGLPSTSKEGSGKSIPSSLIHWENSKTPSSKESSSSSTTVTSLDSSDTTPCGSSPPIVHAAKIIKNTIYLIFELPPLVEFLML